MSTESKSSWSRNARSGRSEAAIRQLTEIPVRVVADLAALAEPADRHMTAPRAGGMPIDGLVRDIEPALAGKPLEFRPRRRPVNVFHTRS
jgi:hypothetical protein